MNKIRLLSTSIIFSQDRSSHEYRWDRPFKHEYFFKRTLNWLEENGFEVTDDPDTTKNYPSIAKDYYLVSKGKFIYRAHIYPNGFEFDFREENLNCKRGWNYWDDELSYLAILFRNNMKYKFKKFFKSILPDVKIEINYSQHEQKKLTAEQRIIKYFRENSWHKPDSKNEDFTLSMWDGTTEEHNYNNTDRDGKTIYNGQIKYFRRNGYLVRGKVYHNINNMWWVIANDTEYYNVACFYLFDLTPEELIPRRQKVDLKPVKYLDLLDKDCPENQIRKILESGITPRKLGQLFSEYCETRCLEQRDYKLIITPEEWYHVEGKYWNWDKVSCKYQALEYYFEIVFRQGAYIIVCLNNERVFEIDNKIRHWNKEKLKFCFDKNNSLFKKIISSINRMRKPQKEVSDNA